ncbi:MAG TPA: GNAT family N-acetyltransferase [Phycisphaerales bacterium]|nr:GNAT family N-acetyltransferase [Phycisphaerales bacterium]
MSQSIDAHVRHCLRGDLRQLEFGHAFAHDRALIRQMFRRHLRGDCCFLVVEVAGVPAGQAWVELPLAPGGVGALWAVRVRPDIRGLGLGSLLVRAALGALVSRGAATAELEVEPHNDGAIRFYERLGFRIEPGPPLRQPPGPALRGLLVMRRPLSGPAQEAA